MSGSTREGRVPVRVRISSSFSMQVTVVSGNGLLNSLNPHDFQTQSHFNRERFKPVVTFVHLVTAHLV